MYRDKFEQILSLVDDFAAVDPMILAVGLCGSWARGRPGEDSDIDLSIIVTDKMHYKETEWLSRIPFENINDKIISFQDREYGNVWSRHVLLKSKAKIEFSFANPTWANIEPLDAGTFKVVADGFKVLYDPEQILQQLVEKVEIGRS
ncbi:MAG: nucleotidyltransferase domain-containing protein [Eudoraea sp.]|nr:nucleotidyltransferase domain-containing protein [Eudoraea sp.]